MTHVRLGGPEGRGRAVIPVTSPAFVEVQVLSPSGGNPVLTCSFSLIGLK